MAIIIKIEDDKVLIGTDDGGIKEVTNDSFGFTPAIGDEIEIFENNNRTLILKKEKAKENVDIASSNSSGGININVRNTIDGTPQSGNLVSRDSSTKVVNKIAYCLLALFLGFIGVHKFYAGKTGAGICYLLFCWTLIPEILAIIDLIVGLCKHSDSNGNIVV